jgi:hypothetical protein
MIKTPVIINVCSQKKVYQLVDRVLLIKVINIVVITYGNPDFG